MNMEGQLTPEERAQLEPQLHWVNCTFCEGQSVNWTAGKFCCACGNSGRVLKSTANILEGTKPFFQASIANLYAENDMIRAGMDEIDKILQRVHAASITPPVFPSPSNFQARVEPWFRACFPPAVCEDKIERTDRFIEEALELAQAGGYSRERAHALVDYVFSRPAGEPVQEVGGVMVTLAAYCIAHALDMHDAGELELARISEPAVMEKIRAKQAAKPVGSALPVAYSGAPVDFEWIEHDGGDCPCDPDARVEISTHGGDLSVWSKASQVIWNSSAFIAETGGTIPRACVVKKYRIIKPEPCTIPAPISTYGAIDQGYEPTGEAQ